MLLKSGRRNDDGSPRPPSGGCPGSLAANGTPVVATVVDALAAVATLLLLLSNSPDGKFAASEARRNQAMAQFRTEVNARLDRRQEEGFKRLEPLLQ